MGFAEETVVILDRCPRYGLVQASVICLHEARSAQTFAIGIASEYVSCEVSVLVICIAVWSINSC